MTNGKNLKIIKILSVIGILLASYLFYNFLKQPKYQICTISSTVNCDAVTKGSLALFLGVPVALVGLIGYVLILTGAFFKKSNFMFYMALFGTLFCLRVTFLEIFDVKVLCPVCIGCQLDMLLLLFFSWRNLKQSFV